MLGKTSAVALLAGAAFASAANVPAVYPHVPLVLWSQRSTFVAQDAYVNAVFDESETARVLSSVLSRDAAKDNYNVLNHASSAPQAEALCVFVCRSLATSQLADFGAASFVRSAVTAAASSVVVPHTTRSRSLTQELKSVDHPVVAVEDVDAWIQSAQGKSLLANGQADLVVVEVPEHYTLAQADAQIKHATDALTAATDGAVDFALTGDEAEPVIAKEDPFARRRRLTSGTAVTADTIICDAGYLVGLSASGKAYCFSHYVRMTPQILTALLFGFFFLFLAYVGLSVLHAIQTPQRYPLHGPPKGKEF